MQLNVSEKLEPINIKDHVEKENAEEFIMLYDKQQSL